MSGWYVGLTYLGDRLEEGLVASIWGIVTVPYFSYKYVIEIQLCGCGSCMVADLSIHDLNIKMDVVHFKRIFVAIYCDNVLLLTGMEMMTRSGFVLTIASTVGMVGTGPKGVLISDLAISQGPPQSQAGALAPGYTPLHMTMGVF